MNRIIAYTAILLTIILSLAADSEKPRGVFSSLEVGQKVNLSNPSKPHFSTSVSRNELSLTVGKVAGLGRFIVPFTGSNVLIGG